MKIDWTTVFAVVVAIFLIGLVKTFLTKQKIDMSTGEIVTKFNGFDGEST